MIKNRTYRNFIIVMNKIMAKGYDKEEAERITRNIFDQREACPDGLSVECLVDMVIGRDQWITEN